MRPFALIVAAIITALAWPTLAARTPPPEPKPSCKGTGTLDYVCGFAAVEDLVPIENGRFLVGSSYKPNSVGLYLVDVAAKVARPLRLTIAKHREARFAACPPPDLRRLDTHGLAAVPQPDGTAIVYAVNHGGRESVEVFRVDAAAGTGAWVGCVVLPPGTNGNSVAALPGGRLAVTRFDDAGDARGLERIMRGEVTGLVYIWTPGGGFSEVPGSRLSGDNGLLASVDGRWLYVCDYGRNRVRRLALDGKARPLVTEVAFHPDNLRWATDGTILAAGQIVKPGSLTALHDWAVARIDPATMTATPLLREPGRPEFDSATTAIEAGGALWFGSFRGDRIAYRPLPQR